MKIWPNDYYKWTGDINSLAQTAQLIIKNLFLEKFNISSTKNTITVRSIRKYQQTKILGSGKRCGKKSIFSYDDLSALVAAKFLIKDGWTINNILNITPESREAMNVVNNLLLGSSTVKDIDNFSINSKSARIAPLNPQNVSLDDLEVNGKVPPDFSQSLFNGSNYRESSYKKFDGAHSVQLNSLFSQNIQINDHVVAEINLNLKNNSIFDKQPDFLKPQKTDTYEISDWLKISINKNKFLKKDLKAIENELVNLNQIIDNLIKNKKGIYK